MAHFSFHQATSNKQKHKLTIAETITRDQYPYHYETGQYNENLKVVLDLNQYGTKLQTPHDKSYPFKSISYFVPIVINHSTQPMLSRKKWGYLDLYLHAECVIYYSCIRGHAKIKLRK